MPELANLSYLAVTDNGSTQEVSFTSKCVRTLLVKFHTRRGKGRCLEGQLAVKAPAISLQELKQLTEDCMTKCCSDPIQKGVKERRSS